MPIAAGHSHGFEQSGFDLGEYGIADVLARAKNTSVDGMKDAELSPPRVVGSPPSSQANYEALGPCTAPRLSLGDRAPLIRVLEADAKAQPGSRNFGRRKLSRQRPPPPTA